jgi:hypothetical protein
MTLPGIEVQLAGVITARVITERGAIVTPGNISGLGITGMTAGSTTPGIASTLGDTGTIAGINSPGAATITGEQRPGNSPATTDRFAHVASVHLYAGMSRRDAMPAPAVALRRCGGRP